MRPLRFLAPAVVALAVSAVDAAPVETFPTRFADHERAVAVATGSRAGRTIRRVRRGNYDATLVFDDAANLHFETSVEAPYPVDATWTSPSARVVVFRYTAETIEAATDWAMEQIGVGRRPRVRVGPGRLVFSRDGTTYRGRQTIRGSLLYRGARISVVETITLRGTRED